MPRRFETTSTFAAGEVSSEYHHRPNIQSVQNAAKEGLNVVLNKAGGVESRRPFVNVAPAWFNLDDDSRAIPFKGLDDDWAIVYRASKTGVINGVKLYAINLSNGTNPNIYNDDGTTYGASSGGSVAYYEAVTPSGADVPIDNAPSYVQIENTLFIASYGSPVVQVRWDDSISQFRIALAKFYSEASGVGVEMLNASGIVKARGSDVLDTTGATPAQKEILADGLTRWNTEIPGAGTTIRIAGRNFTGQGTAWDTITLTANWNGPNVTIPYPPAYPYHSGHPLGANSEGLIYPRGVALFQNRLIFIADAGDDSYATIAGTADEPRPLSVIMSSTYDPYVINPAVQILGVSPSAPVNININEGTETELMWVQGGDSLVIGGAQGEYTLANPKQPIDAGNPASWSFRKTSNYGSTTESAVLSHKGNVIFSPVGGGELLSVKFDETMDKFFTGNLAPLAHHLVGSARSLEIFESTTDDPVSRIFLITDDNKLRIGSFTDLMEVPGWFPQDVYAVTPLEVIEVNNTIYMYVKKSFGTNDHTFLKYDTSLDYCLDFQETCTVTSGSAPTTDWSFADALPAGLSGTDDMFAITSREYVWLRITAGDMSNIVYGMTLTMSGGGTGAVHEWGLDSSSGDNYVIIRTPSGTINATGTATGTSVSLTYVKGTDSNNNPRTKTYTKATQAVGSAIITSPAPTTNVRLEYPANTCIVGFPYTVHLDPINVQSQDEIGSTMNRKRRVLSARVRYRDTRNFYIQNVVMLPDMVAPLEAELLARSGVARRTFLRGWRTEDDFRIQNVVPYRLLIDDITREVAS